jgi:primosomal protein N' (replication factor Y)
VQKQLPKQNTKPHPSRQDKQAFKQEEIKFRESMRYPPVTGLINAIVRSRTSEAAMQDASEIVRALRSTKQPFRVLGPAPAPLSRLKGEHRVQFFLKGANRGVMRRALQAALAARSEVARRTTVDVDPVSVM